MVLPLLGRMSRSRSDALGQVTVCQAQAMPVTAVALKRLRHSVRPPSVNGLPLGIGETDGGQCGVVFAPQVVNSLGA